MKCVMTPLQFAADSLGQLDLFLFFFLTTRNYKAEHEKMEKKKKKHGLDHYASAGSPFI